MLKELIILILVGYLLSKVVRFLLPIFRISSHVGKQMRNMQQQMNDMNGRMNQPTPTKNAGKEGDYIDYEEVK